MQVAISTQGTTLDAPVDSRFGRCDNFLIVDPETFEFTVISNPNVGASGGAGIQTAQLIAKKEVKAVLTGHCGPKAFQTLQAAGISVLVDVTGTVREAVEGYKSGQLQPTEHANAEGHSGLQQRKGAHRA